MKVLLLGAAGVMGSDFIEEYKNNKNYSNFYELILGVHRKRVEENFESRNVDLSDVESLKSSLKGIDVIVNLAGNPNPSAEFKDLIEPNIMGVHNLFEAAKEAKCKRIIIASSVHAIKGYPEEKKVSESDSPMPKNAYGASKAFGETLCSVFSKDLSCFAIRIGLYLSNNKNDTSQRSVSSQKEVICLNREDLEYALTQRDMAQLIHKSIVAPLSLKYAILHGSSNNKNKKMNIDITKKLIGYEPEDDAFMICGEIKQNIKTLNK